jgi:hypothetical protein
VIIKNKQQGTITVFWEGKEPDCIVGGAVKIDGEFVLISPDSVFKNKKTGNHYVVLTVCFDANKKGKLENLTPSVVYKRTDTMIPVIWTREAKEFSEKFEYCGKYKPDIKLFISKKI